MEAPTRASQARLLGLMAASLEPLRRLHKLPEYELRPAVRGTRRWGSCTHRPGHPPEIVVRCATSDEAPGWRKQGAIVATLLHEMAHLRYRSHGPRFWGLLRDLLNQAADAGVYHAAEDDHAEDRRGNAKLAGSAADQAARAALARKRARAARNRAAARGWTVGGLARVTLRRGALAGAVVQIQGVARSWVTVQTHTGARYRVIATALERVAETG